MLLATTKKLSCFIVMFPVLCKQIWLFVMIGENGVVFHCTSSCLLQASTCMLFSTAKNKRQQQQNKSKQTTQKHYLSSFVATVLFSFFVFVCLSVKLVRCSVSLQNYRIKKHSWTFLKKSCCNKNNDFWSLYICANSYNIELKFKPALKQISVINHTLSHKCDGREARGGSRVCFLIVTDSFEEQ